MPDRLNTPLAAVEELVQLPIPAVTFDPHAAPHAHGEHDDRDGDGDGDAHAGTEFLQVKTLGAVHASPEYAATRKSYEALGYRALEEFEENTIWPGNPYLVMVKALSG